MRDSNDRARLEAAFNMVADPNDWRAPIDAYVPKDTDLVLLEEAIVFYTATTPTFTVALGKDQVMRIRVRADGYRAGPAGP